MAIAILLGYWRWPFSAITFALCFARIWDILLNVLQLTFTVFPLKVGTSGWPGGKKGNGEAEKKAAFRTCILKLSEQVASIHFKLYGEQREKKMRK